MKKDHHTDQGKDQIIVCFPAYNTLTRIKRYPRRLVLDMSNLGTNNNMKAHARRNSFINKPGYVLITYSELSRGKNTHTFQSQSIPSYGFMPCRRRSEMMGESLPCQ